ncbi:MAG TPA: pyridoxamine 5'-phosphate oxidase family protein [Syntrophorhabdales bacterium]|nr:pyridoxamine 5'-phosphate oxidase family protein [Syntrophorhabdales bacterium]
MPGAKHDQKKDLSQILSVFEDLRFAVLATSGEGKPYASLIAFAFTADRRNVIFATSKATRKYKNMMNQGSVSILIDNRSQRPEDLSRAEAVTLLGTARLVRAGARKKEYSNIFLGKHPELSTFIDDPGTALMMMAIEEAIHVTRFQNVSVWSERAG